MIYQRQFRKYDQILSVPVTFYQQNSSIKDNEASLLVQYLILSFLTCNKYVSLTQHIFT